jgi:HAD domain in Swiss Army Knife RNA repair proteins
MAGHAVTNRRWAILQRFSIQPSPFSAPEQTVIFDPERMPSELRRGYGPNVDSLKQRLIEGGVRAGVADQEHGWSLSYIPGAELPFVDSAIAAIGRPAAQVMLFLDVDGVMSPIRPLGDAWGDQTFSPDPVTNAAFYASELMARSFHPVLYRTEFVWATTWEQRANSHVSLTLAIPHGRVLAREPDPEPSRQWWKWLRVASEVGTRNLPFVWVDDELHGYLKLDPQVRVWADQLTVEHLFVSPDPAIGLTPNHVELITEFVKSHDPNFEHTSSTNGA